MFHFQLGLCHPPATRNSVFTTFFFTLNGNICFTPLHGLFTGHRQLCELVEPFESRYFDDRNAKQPYSSLPFSGAVTC
jgi:hypothetical protein